MSASKEVLEYFIGAYIREYIVGISFEHAFEFDLVR